MPRCKVPLSYLVWELYNSFIKHTLADSDYRTNPLAWEVGGLLPCGRASMRANLAPCARMIKKRARPR